MYRNDYEYGGQFMDLQTNFLNFSDNMSSSSPEAFIFSGNAYSLQAKSNEMNTQELQKYKSLRINITGTQTKGNDLCCFWATIIVGSIIIFPLFFICCNWWKKRINKLYEV